MKESLRFPFFGKKVDVKKFLFYKVGTFHSMYKNRDWEK